MDLKEFVRTSLEEIVLGVQEAKASCAEKGVVIAPVLYKDGTQEKTKPTAYPVTESVEFDIAVSVEKSGDAGAEIKVLGVELGNVSGKIKQENVSRIKFRVPYYWQEPVHVSSCSVQTVSSSR